MAAALRGGGTIYRRWKKLEWLPRDAPAGASRPRRASARQHDEVGPEPGLGTQALVGDDEGEAGRHQLGEAVADGRRHADAFERLRRARRRRGRRVVDAAAAAIL